MAQYTAEDFRNLVNKLDEYMIVVDEADDSVPGSDSQPIDKLLTKPAGLQKVAGRLDVDRLINLLNIPYNLQNDFKSAISILHDDNPTLNQGQTLALVTAFDHMLAARSNGKEQVLNKIDSVSTAEVTEAADDVDAPNTDIHSVEAAIKLASNASPVAKLQATKLVKHLTDGIADKHINGGISHVMSGIVAAIESAKNGSESDALKHISRMVNYVEGDNHAVSARSFPHIVVNLMLLVGDLLQHTER